MQIISVAEDSFAWKRLQDYYPLKYHAELGELTDKHKDRAESFASRNCIEICNAKDCMRANDRVNMP